MYHQGAHHTASKGHRRPGTTKRPHGFSDKQTAKSRPEKNGVSVIQHPYIDTALLWLLGYLVGSISTAVLVSRLLGFSDPREAGSHNAGATNVLRLGGRWAGLLTLIGDILKGVLPPLICIYYDKSHPAIVGAGIAAVTGHLLPVYFRFQGGKGVATGIGVLAVWHWPTCVVLLVSWLLVATVTRYSSLASMLSFLVASLYAAIFTPHWVEPIMLLTAMILYKHRQNLQNLKEGKEPRLG